jgi:hypothetical protein
MQLINTEESTKELIELKEKELIASKIDILLSEGRMWVEIVNQLNALSKNYQAISYYQKIYTDFLPKMLYIVDDQELEKQRMLNELDWIILEATKGYRLSLEDKIESKQTQGYVKNKKSEETETIDENILKDNKGNMITLTEVKGKGDTSFLNTIMNAIDKKCKILGITIPKNKDFNPTVFFQSLNQMNIQNNNITQYPKPVKSESEALDISDNIDVTKELEKLNNGL